MHLRHTAPEVVLVLLNGRPLSINWAAENVPAILEAWEPGTEGGNAVADVLFGDVNPGGKLPVTFPRSGAHCPLYYAHNRTHSPEGAQTEFQQGVPMYSVRYWDGAPTPLYPFGYGLSYTTFAYSGLNVPDSLKAGRPLPVDVTVKNTGARAGDEVAQVYLSFPDVKGAPIRALRAFQR